MSKKSKAIADKTFRQAPEELTLEERARWAETGKLDDYKVRIPKGGKNTSTTVSIQTGLLYPLEERLAEYKTKTQKNHSRSRLLRVWLYALLNTEDAFLDVFLDADSEDEMLDILLKQLEK